MDRGMEDVRKEIPLIKLEWGMTKKHKVELFSPRYEGTRFMEHRFPLDLLDDLSTLKNMTIEMAKALYLEKNPERKRVPKNFTNDISIELESIEPGSTVPKLILITPMEGLFPWQNAEYFTEAPERIKKAIELAHLDREVYNSIISDKVLSYFNHFGSNLKEDERIVFGNGAKSKVVLDKTTRKRLVLAASKTKEYNAPFELRGIVTALDKERKTFEIQSVTAGKIKGEYTAEHLEVLQQGLILMEDQRKIYIRGTGTFNESDRLLKILKIEDQIVLEAFDVPARLEELTQLPKGWLDGEQGEPLSKKATIGLGETFDRWFDSENLPLPATFPTPEGNIQFEWSINDCEISIKVDLTSNHAEFYALNTKDHSEYSDSMDLTSREDWNKINQKIREIYG